MGAVVWAATNEPLAVPAAIVGGVLIDSDHLIDTFDKREGDTNLKIHMWRPFHAWEYAILGTIVYALFFTNPVFLAFLIGYVSHIALDNLANVTHPMAYFVTFRASRGFKRRHLTPHLFDSKYRAYVGPMPFWAKVEPTLWWLVSRRRNKRK